MNLMAQNGQKLWFWGLDFLFNFMLFIIKRLNLDPFRLNSYRFLVQFLLFETWFKLSSFPLDSSPRAPLPDFTFGKFINGHSSISNGPSYMAHMIWGHMIWGHMIWVIWYGIGFRAKIGGDVCERTVTASGHLKYLTNVLIAQRRSNQTCNKNTLWFTRLEVVIQS